MRRAVNLQEEIFDVCWTVAGAHFRFCGMQIKAEGTRTRA